MKQPRFKTRLTKKRFNDSSTVALLLKRDKIADLLGLDRPIDVARSIVDREEAYLKAFNAGAPRAFMERAIEVLDIEAELAMRGILPVPERLQEWTDYALANPHHA